MTKKRRNWHLYCKTLQDNMEEDDWTATLEIIYTGGNSDRIIGWLHETDKGLRIQWRLKLADCYPGCLYAALDTIDEVTKNLL